MIQFTDVLQKLLERKNLQPDEAAFALGEIMQGKINPAQIAAFLTALKIKGETGEEIAAFAKTMRENGISIAPKVNHLVDTAGTGGDGSRTFNISTCAALVAAGAGAVVAKHGNRAASSQSGSADVLEELGVKIQVDAAIAEKQLETIGIAFLFAPSFHPAMKHVAPVRKELGFKTVFNMLGPLTNPAGAKRQVIGVYDKNVLQKMAQALQLLGTEKALLVSSDVEVLETSINLGCRERRNVLEHDRDLSITTTVRRSQSMDEISISNETNVIEVVGERIMSYIISPEDFGFKRVPLDALRVEDKTQSAKVILDVLGGKEGPARDVVLLNAGAAIYASGIASSVQEGIRLAEKSIDSGKAMEKLNALRDFHD